MNNRAILLVLLTVLHLSAHATEYNVLGFGAKGDGLTLDTAPMQAAIDQCSAEGGGTLLIPGGQILPADRFSRNSHS